MVVGSVSVRVRQRGRAARVIEAAAKEIPGALRPAAFAMAADVLVTDEWSDTASSFRAAWRHSGDGRCNRMILEVKNRLQCDSGDDVMTPVAHDEGGVDGGS